jgi:cation:H+ antiporter
MIDLSQLPVSAVTIAFIASAAVIGIVGTRIAQIADRLADTTGWGEAVFGGVFLGASTSLPGIVMSVTAALDGHADLAFSNALGGIAAQTVFLAIADMFYRRANLEHAAASVPNMMQGALLLILLTAVLLFMTSPAIAVWGVHPGSLALLLAYVFAVRMIAAARQRSTWQAATTPETVLDQPENAQPPTRTEVSQLWLKFWVYAAVLAVAGFFVARSAETFCDRTGASESIVGGLFTAVATSLPELVTAVAAVRKGALTLAVGDIIGGNSFDVLFVAAADVAYRGGSIYHAVQDRQRFMVALAALLTAILLLGLLRREKRGIANIGFESFFVLLVYVGGVVVLAIW